MTAMQAILFDLDGVIYQDETAIAGAKEVVAWVREQGIPHMFLTNTTSRPRSAIVAKLRTMGIDISVTALLTPPVAAARWLNESGLRNIALFVTEVTASEFSALPSNQQAPVDAVVVGDLGERWDFPTLNNAFRLLMSESAPRLVALGMTRYWLSESGLRLDVGPFIKALEYATGHEAIVMGKPAPHYFNAALSALGVSAERTLMIGDDIRGDIEGAQRLGMKTVLVRTGKFRSDDLAQGVRPDGVLGSVADLPDWWRRYSGFISPPPQAS